MLEEEIPGLLIVYFCTTETEKVILSDEHQDYAWADEEMCRKLLPKAIVKDFEENGVFGGG